MNYHALGLLPPGTQVLDGGGLTSPRDSGKLRSTLKIHEGGRMLLGPPEVRKAREEQAIAEAREQQARTEKTEHEAEQARRAATFDDVLMTANLALRALDRVVCVEDLQAWKSKHTGRLGVLRPMIAKYMNDISADLPWEKAREEYRDLLFAARDTYQRPA